MANTFTIPYRARRISLLALSVVLHLIAPSFAAEQQPASKIEKALAQSSIRLTEVDGMRDPWEKHVKRLLVESGVSGGIVENETHLKKQPETTGPKGAHVSGKELLDRLSLQNPGYKWQAIGASINVLPQELNKEPLSILNARAKHFSTRARSASVAIFDLLKAQGFPIRPDSRFMLGGIKPKSIPEEREFSCEDKRVLDCMNSFAAEDGSMFWHLYFHKRIKAYVITSMDEKEMQ